MLVVTRSIRHFNIFLFLSLEMKASHKQGKTQTRGFDNLPDGGQAPKQR